MISRIIVIVILFNVLFVRAANAQEEKSYIRSRIETLASPSLHGRGYVMNGGELAAKYIAHEFKSNGLIPAGQNDSYFQDYTFSVNTFPGDLELKINYKYLEPGVDYIVHAASSEWHSNGPSHMERIDLTNVKDSASWDNVKNDLMPNNIYYLHNADTPTKYLKLGIRKFATELPQGLFVVPKHGKLIWTANQNRVPGTIVYVEDTVISPLSDTVELELETEFVKHHNAKNVIGVIPGTEVKDSFIVFTAHYDHLGRMGKEALFAGANDNASGTSFVLYLAHYFARHPQRYSVAFMLFSGEEAGLLGSKYYVNHPLFPLEQIRFLVNLDMTGDATNGMTVVNGVSHEPEFALLEKINTENEYLPEVKKRERTNNSDHYYFSKEGVPAVFIYGNGTKPHYHDVFDLPDEVNLENVDNMAKLLIEFTRVISGTK